MTVHLFECAEQVLSLFKKVTVSVSFKLRDQFALARYVLLAFDNMPLGLL